MTDGELREAQARLEEKRRESGRQPRQTPTGLELEERELRCLDCGGMFSERTPAALAAIRPASPVCPECAAKRANARDELLQKERDAVERDRKEQQISAFLKASNIGARFRGMTFDDYQPVCAEAAKVKAECERWVESFNPRGGGFLVMLGRCGTGKNMLAAIAGQELMRQGFSCLHTSVMKLVRRVKDSWRTREGTEEEVIRSFTVPDLLIVDEVGVQFESATEQLILTEIINDRYEALRSTILISNLTIKQLAEVIGERAVDRFYEGNSRLLAFTWQSYRRASLQRVV